MHARAASDSSTTWENKIRLRFALFRSVWPDFSQPTPPIGSTGCLSGWEPISTSLNAAAWLAESGSVWCLRQVLTAHGKKKCGRSLPRDAGDRTKSLGPERSFWPMFPSAGANCSQRTLVKPGARRCMFFFPMRCLRWRCRFCRRCQRRRASTSIASIPPRLIGLSRCPQSFSSSEAKRMPALFPICGAMLQTSVRRLSAFGIFRAIPRRLAVCARTICKRLKLLGGEGL